MVENEEEIKKMHADYQDKYEHLGNAVVMLNNNAKQIKDQDQRAIATRKVKEAASSSLFGLYANLAKNCSSVLKLGQSAFPSSEATYDGNQGRFSITNNPRFTSTLNKYFPSLYRLASRSSEKTDDGKTTVPCLTSGIDAPRAVLELNKNKRSQDLDNVVLPNYNQEGAVRFCPNKACESCADCSGHKTELFNAIQGIAKASNGMRNLHMKNLITVLGSWAVHMDQRGGNRDTQDDPRYINQHGTGCHARHDMLGTFMRLVGRRLHDSYTKDYKETNGLGGGRHRDYFGPEYGDDESAY